MTALLLEKVSKSFGRGDSAVQAVDGISLAVQPGEVLLVMGPSGSGKTSLLAIAGTLMRPDSGKVFVGGLEVTSLKERDLPAVRRERIGFIFQSFQLIGTLTARENVELVARLAGKPDPGRRARQLLEELGLSRRLDFLPAQLSGGEKQRVAIARALAADPAIILADEPTANLDSRSGQQVAALLAQVARERGKAVVIVSHDGRLREIAGQMIWMEDGRLHHGDSGERKIEG